MKYEDGFPILTDAEVELLACTGWAKVEPGYEANYYFDDSSSAKDASHCQRFERPLLRGMLPFEIYDLNRVTSNSAKTCRSR